MHVEQELEARDRQARGCAEGEKVMRRRERDERRARGQLKQNRERIFAYIEVPSTYRVVRKRDRESRIHLPAQQLQRERRRLVACKDARPGQQLSRVPEGGRRDGTATAR